MNPLFDHFPRRGPILTVAGLVLLSGIGGLLYWKSAGARTSPPSRAARRPIGEPGAGAGGPAPGFAVVTLNRAQQKAIGLTVVAATAGEATDVVETPGQVVPDES